MVKTYEFRIFPTKEQEQFLLKTNGLCRLYWNTSLARKQKAWNNPLAHMGDGQTKPGYSRFNWTPDTVLPIRLREGMMTLINLPTWMNLRRNKTRLLSMSCCAGYQKKTTVMTGIAI